MVCIRRPLWNDVILLQGWSRITPILASLKEVGPNTNSFVWISGVPWISGVQWISWVSWISWIPWTF